MSTLENAAAQAQSAGSSVNGVIGALDGADAELDDAVTQFEAVGVSDKAAEAHAAKDSLEALKARAIALQDGIQALENQIRAISG